MPKSGDDESLLLVVLDQGYERSAWHGPNLRQALRGITAEQAAWRPTTGRHNIWEIAVHAAYWKYRVRRKLLGGNGGSFSLKGSNWFKRPMEISEEAWRADLALLESEHRKLRQALSDYVAGKARALPPRTLFGVAFHDVYHAGQIRLLRRLYEQNRSD